MVKIDIDYTVDADPCTGNLFDSSHRYQHVKINLATSLSTSSLTIVSYPAQPLVLLKETLFVVVYCTTLGGSQVSVLAKISFTKNGDGTYANSFSVVS